MISPCILHLQVYTKYFPYNNSKFTALFTPTSTWFTMSKLSTTSLINGLFFVECTSFHAVTIFNQTCFFWEITLKWNTECLLHTVWHDEWQWKTHPEVLEKSLFFYRWSVQIFTCILMWSWTGTTEGTKESIYITMHHPDLNADGGRPPCPPSETTF